MDNVYKCPKCQAERIPIANKLMHDATCKGKPIKQESSLHPIQQPIPNSQLNCQKQSQPLAKSEVKQEANEEIILCEKCDTYFPIREIDDHLLSHQLVESEEQNEENQHNLSNEAEIDEEQHNFPYNANRRVMPHFARQAPQEYRFRRERDRERRHISHLDNRMNIIGHMSYPQPQQFPPTVNRTITQNPQGYSTETTTEQLPNGYVKTTSIIRDPLGNMVSNTQTQAYNGHNNSYTMNVMPGMNQMSMQIQPQIGMPSRMNMNMYMPNLNASNFNRHHIQDSFMNDPFFNQMIHQNNQNGLAQFLQHVMGHHEHPVSEEIINELPVINIDDPSKLDADKKQCVICLNDYSKGEKGIVLPCIHLFHSECIKNWFQTQNTCPICKFKLNRQDEEN